MRELEIFAFEKSNLKFGGAGHQALQSLAPSIYASLTRLSSFSVCAQPAHKSRYTPSSAFILAIFSRHTIGPVAWTLSPVASTATVTGMSWTVNS